MSSLESRAQTDIATDAANAQPKKEERSFQPVVAFVLTFLLQGAGLTLVNNRFWSGFFWMNVALLIPVTSIYLFAASGDASWPLYGLAVFLIFAFLLALYAVNISKKKMDRHGSSGKFVALIIYANVMFVFAAVVLCKETLETFNTPQSSMAPSIIPGDIFFVGKTKRVYKRGDIVVFQLPGKKDTKYVKRIVGLPGDAVQIKQGVLYVNQKRITAKTGIRYQIRDHKKQLLKGTIHKERFGQRQHEIFLDKGQIASSSSLPEQNKLYKVPAKHYFMLGDNRRNSYDSRMFGPVPTKNVIGKALRILISIGGPEEFRVERVMKPMGPQLVTKKPAK